MPDAPINILDVISQPGVAAKWKELAEAELERRKRMPQSPAALGEMVSGGRFTRPRHIQYIDKKLVELATGKIKRMILTVPPRHGKSTVGSQYFPAWFLGMNPNKSVILCSYGASFAAEWGEKARNILLEHGERIFGVRVNENSKARDNWKIDKREGGMITAGVGGQITGRGADLLVIDDVHKNGKEAASSTIRQGVWRWWQDTAYTRLSPDGVVLLIMTRWHQEDLAGMLIATNGDQDDDDEEDAKGAADERWHVVNFPALAEEDDALGRQPGEALWPERWPATKLKRKRSKIGPHVFASLYQQRPSPESGEVFQRGWFRYYRKDGDVYTLFQSDNMTVSYRVAENKCTRIATMDVAASEEQSADYTVIQVWDVTPSYDAILVEQWRQRVQSPDAIAAAASIYRRLNVQVMGVERNGVGLGVYQALKKKSITVKPLYAKNDKKTRTLVAAQARMQAGMIFFPQAAPWLGDLERELLDFPKGAHDDCTDALSWGCLMIQDMGGTVRDTTDDEWDKKLDAERAAETNTSTRPGTRIESDAVAVGAGANLSDDARLWMNGGCPKWLRPGRN